MHPFPKHHLLVTLAVGILGFTSPAEATTPPTTIYEWSGNGGDNNAQNDGNWVGGSSPIGQTWFNYEDIDDIHLLFADATSSYLFYDKIYANTIEFRNINRPYRLEGDYETTHIGSGGIGYSSTDDFWSTIETSVQLHASQVWDIQNGVLNIFGNISDQTGESTSGMYQIEKTGAGTLELSGGYTDDWGGGLKLSEGVVSFSYFYGYTSLGSGTLIFNGGKLEANDRDSYGYDDATLTNNVVSNGLVSIHSRTPLAFENNESESNFFRLDADTTFEIEGSPVYISKDITESGGARKVTVDSDTALILMGNSGWSGGTHVESGVLIFGGEDNTPRTPNGILIDSEGYAGIGVDNDVSSFLSQIDSSNSTGAIGFDSDPEEGVDTFSAAIDLTGFNNEMRIGSATRAVLSGTITPQGTDYRFGGGGGELYVSSHLSDLISIPAGIIDGNIAAAPGYAPGNIIADSPQLAPLTVHILNTSNSLTGSVTAHDSAIIFGDGVPLPGSPGGFTMNSGGYIGYAVDPDNTNPIAPSTFVDQFSSSTAGIIGFDITQNTAVTREVDLTGISLSGFTNDVSFGTASVLRDAFGDVTGAGVRFTGTIAGDASGVHRFAAYKGGALEITGTLTGNSLVIGHPDSLGAFGTQRDHEHSTIHIAGNNAGALAGGTTFYGGHLKIGQDTADGTIGTDATNALGNGALSVMPLNLALSDDDGPTPLLTVSADDIIFANDIYLGTDLSVGDMRNFTLAGNISGMGEITIGEETDSTLNITLSGNNSHAGGVYLTNGSSATFSHDNAVGMGELSFGPNGGYAEFTTANPVVHGLQSNGEYAYLSLSAETDRTLTINQSEYGYFSGNIEASGAATIIKTGAATLQFEGAYNSSGITDTSERSIGLDVQEGTFIIGSDSSLGSAGIRISGGTLANNHDSIIYNPIYVDSGRIAGYGTYYSSVSINRGAILSPGLNNQSAIGALNFSHLELGSGGIYEFNIQSPDTDGHNGHDFVSVFTDTTLVINSTTVDPFIIKVISLGANGELGDLEGIDDDYGTYSWTLFSFDSLSIPATSNLFDADLFAFDLSEFSLESDLSGDFDLVQDGNNFILTFTPVPEPSTFAMMALGLGIIALTVSRRRRP